MKDLKGSKTEMNLMAAFNGESQARNKYTFLPKRQSKTDTNRFQEFLPKPRITKKNMQSCGI